MTHVKTKTVDMMVGWDPPFTKIPEHYERGMWEQPNMDLIRNGKYPLFIDVGAAWGWFPMIASRIQATKKIDAYEAHPLRYGLLLYNMRKLDKVKCHYKYVGCEESKPVMKIDFKRMISPYPMKAEPYNIDVIRLDDEYHPAERTLIKVDVEGGEIDVLKGARELCKLKRVDWTIDVHTWVGVTMKQVKSFFDPSRNFNISKNRLIVR